MSDDELMEYTISGEENSLGLGQAAMQMRAAAGMQKATEELARFTKWIACATWGVVAITLIAQIANIYFFAAIYK